MTRRITTADVLTTSPLEWCSLVPTHMRPKGDDKKRLRFRFIGKAPKALEGLYFDAFVDGEAAAKKAGFTRIGVTSRFERGGRTK